jgi:hypothetical protein
LFTQDYSKLHGQAAQDYSQLHGQAAQDYSQLHGQEIQQDNLKSQIQSAIVDLETEIPQDFKVRRRSTTKKYRKQSRNLTAEVFCGISSVDPSTL